MERQLIVEISDSFSKSTTVESPRPAACTSCDCVIPSSVERTRNRTKNHERVEPAGAPAAGSRCSWRTTRVARRFVSSRSQAGAWATMLEGKTSG
jgi:hypothetical protein